MSFLHSSGPICIPPGWEAVGAERTDKHHAIFDDDATGVMIRSSTFASTTITFTDSSYIVHFLYPSYLSEQEVATYSTIITNAFDHIGALYNDTNRNPLRVHTVLATIGIGNSESERDSIYPDPNGLVSYLILPATHERSEELFIHAIAHLYNRFRPDLDAYQSSESPIPAEDWQELEAAWAETAFESSDRFRTTRLSYLYNVHVAVQENDFSRISRPPFNDYNAFTKLRKSVPEDSTSTFLDTQYGHYILYPLILTAIEGLLAERQTHITVGDILEKVHTENGVSFFETLTQILPPHDMEDITHWMDGTALIPESFVHRGEDIYRH